MKTYAATDTGKVRQQNQDFFLISTDEDSGYAACVVCDGMGGASAGNVASELAAKCFMETLEAGGRRLEKRITEYMTRAVEAANVLVYKKSTDEPDLRGMGTTLVAAVIFGKKLFVLNIGDSRAYLLHGGELCQLTHDHSVVESLVQSGSISRDEARTHPQKNLITRAVGTEAKVTPDIFELDVDSGDIVLLCTDGLSNVLSDSEILSLCSDADIEVGCGRLISSVLESGAPDNVTAALIAV